MCAHGVQILVDVVAAPMVVSLMVQGRKVPEEAGVSVDSRPGEGLHPACQYHHLLQLYCAGSSVVVYYCRAQLPWPVLAAILTTHLVL